MGTFCPNLSGNHTTTHYSNHPNMALSMIFHVIRERFCVLGHNSKFLSLYSQLLKTIKVYHTLQVRTSLIKSAACWEVA